MSTRKRKNDEELVALPSDESEEEEEYVQTPFHRPTIAPHRYGLNCHLYSFIGCCIASMRIVVDDKAAFAPRNAACQLKWQ
jgi:hypothetical protein